MLVLCPFLHKTILCSLSIILIPKTIDLESFQQIIIIMHSFIKLARCREEGQVLKKLQELASLNKNRFSIHLSVYLKPSLHM